MTVHYIKPVRRVVAQQNTYADYRGDLILDFNNACGYCDDSDLFSDSSCFHIDHFAPKSLFPELENSYNNLIYSCRYCNMRKSNHWIGSDPNIHNNGLAGFIDPCSIDYDQHIRRSMNGRIFGVTELGRYIVRKLHLELLRHELLWQARQARILRSEVEVLIQRCSENGITNSDLFIELAKRFISLTTSIEKYEFAANQRR